MLAEAGVELVTQYQLVEGPGGTEIDAGPPRRLSRLTFEPGAGPLPAAAGNATKSYRPGYVIDGTYEGEVLVAAGVSYTFGREANAKWNESLNGKTAHSSGQFDPPVNPYADPATAAAEPKLLKGVQPGPDPRARLGEADSNLMAYSFRACLTADPENMVPVTEPEGYNPADFELSRRYVLAELAAGKTPSSPWADYTYHGYEQLKKQMKTTRVAGWRRWGSTPSGSPLRTRTPTPAGRSGGGRTTPTSTTCRG